MKILFILLIFINTLFANIILQKDQDKKINFTLEKYYDGTKSMDIEQIQKQSFEKIPSQFTFGHKKGDLWFKFTIQNNSQHEKFVLSFSEPYFNEMSLFRKINNIWQKEENGLIKTIKQRAIPYHNPSFELYIEQNKSKTFYIKANSKLTTAGEFKIFEKSYFNSIYGYYNDLFFMLYFGFIFMITLLNLFLYFRLKEKIYLFYSGYTFFYILWIASYSGLILFTPVDGHYHNFIMVTSLVLMFLILFSSEFLNIKKYIPKAYTPLNIFAYIFGVLAVLISFSFEPWFEVMNTLANIIFLVLFSLAIYILRKYDDVNIKYYLIAMGVYMITISLMSAMVNGWIENNDITRYSFLFGAFFEIVFFTIVLTNRFYIFQNEKLAIQKKLIDFKNKNEIILEKKIEKRTKEITQAYINVNNLSNERKLLLQELHHRVKNNFHIITGLLWMEEENDEKNQKTFQNLRYRIKSMSTIHDKLYTSQGLSYINIQEYLDELILNILSSNREIIISLTKNIANITLKFDDALGVGVILTETIHNSLKHNAGIAKIKINIQLTKNNNTISLKIKDDGKGFNTKEILDGVGLSLISSFAKTLSNSNFDFISSDGVEFILTFDCETDLQST